MRSNFSSYSGYTPSSASSSSTFSSQPVGYRRTSLTPHDDFSSSRGLSTSSSFSSSRDYRASLNSSSNSGSSRFQPSSSRFQDKPISSRVSRDEETRGFLERYNGGGNGSRKTSLGGEQPTSQFLQQRRQQQLDQDIGYHRNPSVSSSFSNAQSPSSLASSQRRQSLDNFGLSRAASSSSPFSGQTLSSPRTSLIEAQTNVNQQNDPNNEFLQRLLAAHNRCDDLLRSRGLNGEDERKYIRTWEEIPIIREERYRRLRTPSGSSDSGLSTDNDSDRSNAEAAPVPVATSPSPPPPQPQQKAVINVAVESESEEEEEDQEQETSRRFDLKQEDEEVYDVFIWPIKSIVREKVEAKIIFPTKSKVANFDLNGTKAKRKLEKGKIANTVLPAKLKTSAALTVKATLSKPAVSVKKSPPPREATPKPAPPPKEIPKILIKVAPPPLKAVVDAKVGMKKQITSPKIQKEVAEKCIIQRSVLFKEQCSFQFTRADDGMTPKILKIKKNKYDEHVKIQQKSILARLKRKPVPVVPCTAEISIQHCSFYSNKTEKDNFAEKNVRLNLRMTERASKQCTATIILPSPPKVAYVREDINLFKIRRDSIERRKTQEIPRTQLPVGKLTKSYTTEIPKDDKELRKVNRLTIPDYFVQSNAEMMKENLKDARDGLKRVAIVGGFVVQPKDMPSTTQLKPIVRRRSSCKEATKDVSNEPYSDFFPTPTNHHINIPSINIINDNQPENGRISISTPTRRRVPPLKNHLNSHGSLALTAKPSGAAIVNCGNINIKPKMPINMTMDTNNNFTEMSDVDRILIERFQSSLFVPRPQAIIRALSPIRGTVRITKSAARLHEQPPIVTFIRRRAPRRRSPTPVREETRINLNRSIVIKKAQVRRHWLDFKIELKQVDFEKHRLRRKPRRKLVRWVPKWRRNCTDEEVEEVEEEEEEEDETESKNESGLENDQSSKSERSKTKSFNEDGESLTEGARAMAAAKRRHEEDQDAKLVDYEERRRTEREKEEEDLKKLKEKQERRRLEREQEEKEMEERRRDAEGRRKQEEDERKARLEEEKRRKEEEKNKRNQLMGGGFPAATGGRNFTIPKKEKSNDKFGNIVQAKQEMGMTKNQQEDAKRAFIATIKKGIPTASDISPSDLKAKIKELHQRICRLETEKYDLEKRHERQEYDLKELNARQRQVTRNSGTKAGAGTADAGNSRYPPKVTMLSKYDRQIDRRNFRERRSVFDRRNAHPCFPGVPPPAAVYEKVFAEVEEVVAEEEEEE